MKAKEGKKERKKEVKEGRNVKERKKEVKEGSEGRKGKRTWCQHQGQGPVQFHTTIRNKEERFEGRFERGKV